MNINELSKEQEKKLFSVILKSEKTKSVLLEVFKNEDYIEEFNLIYDKLLKWEPVEDSHINWIENMINENRRSNKELHQLVRLWIQRNNKNKNIQENKNYEITQLFSYFKEILYKAHSSEYIQNEINRKLSIIQNETWTINNQVERIKMLNNNIYLNWYESVFGSLEKLDLNKWFKVDISENLITITRFTLNWDEEYITIDWKNQYSFFRNWLLKKWTEVENYFTNLKERIYKSNILQWRSSLTESNKEDYINF
jgi:hypothetical protein